jgi:TonB family protein
MNRIRETDFQSAEIESLLREERFEEAVTLLIQRRENDPGEPRADSAPRLARGGRKLNLARTTALMAAAVGILVLPLGYFLSVTENLATELAIFTDAEPRLPATDNAVLAVDALGLKIETNNAPVSVHERLETVAVEHLAKLHRTYSRWAQTDQELMGSLHLKLHVDPAGRVIKIEPVSSHLTNADFNNVVLAEVRKWKFPQAITREASEITVPLLFVPRGMDPNTAVQWERNIRRSDGNEKPNLPAVKPLPPTVAGDTSVAAAPKTALLPAKAKPTSSARPQKTKTETDALVAFKTNQTITLREEPRFSSKSVHEVEGETRLAVLETKGDWLRVRLADAGSVGFVRKEFVMPIDNSLLATR